MKTILAFAGLAFSILFFQWMPSKAFLKKGVGITFPRDNGHDLLVAEQHFLKGRYCVTYRQIVTTDDKTAYVTITLVDLKGPNKPLELPIMPIPILMLDPFARIDTADISVEDSVCQIKGYAKGECIFRLLLRKNKPKRLSKDII